MRLSSCKWAAGKGVMVIQFHFYQAEPYFQVIANPNNNIPV